MLLRPDSSSVLNAMGRLTRNGHGTTMAVVEWRWIMRNSGAALISLALKDDRETFVDPVGTPFFSLGLNHIDFTPLLDGKPAFWFGECGNSREKWLRRYVVPDLKRWGFNSIGWNQEISVKTETIARHTPSFTVEEYNSLEIPFCHMLPFIESHQWELETRLPDLLGQDFESLCRWTSRYWCARLMDNPNLLGYFYVDCPIWVHRPRVWTKAPLFPPEELSSPSGRKKLYALARHYYRLLHDVIREYDQDHLILGDRYEAAERIPEELLTAAAEYVDVISIQDFSPDPEDILGRIDRIYSLTGKPVLLADSLVDKQILFDLPESAEQFREAYRYKLSLLRNHPHCVGWHLCGGYLRHPERYARWGHPGLRGADNSENKIVTTALINA